LERLAYEASEQRDRFFKNAKIHEDKQGKHIVGHRNYQLQTSSDLQPSILKHQDPEKLLREHAGKGSSNKSFKHGDGYKEVVDFKEYIGECFDAEAKQYVPTTRGTIHYDKIGGAHIVPTRPGNP
jgi:filamentous hemagglutinin